MKACMVAPTKIIAGLGMSLGIDRLHAPGTTGTPVTVCMSALCIALFCVACSCSVRAARLGKGPQLFTDTFQ